MGDQVINRHEKLLPSAKEEATVKAVACIEVPVKNMQRAVDFYVFQLGFYMNTAKNRLPIEADNTEVFIYPASGVELMLVQTDGEERLAFNHKGRPNHVLLLEISEDIEACRNRLVKAGITTSSIEDRGGCGKSFDVFDPDGNFIKLWFGHPS
jgi:predicted enzyme related to lactoylglutathione lyase